MIKGIKRLCKACRATGAELWPCRYCNESFCPHFLRNKVPPGPPGPEVHHKTGACARCLREVHARHSDRHAKGSEQSCGAGGCRNLATWLLRSDLYEGRNWLSCNLHRDARQRLMIERKAARDPRVEPFQDPSEPTPRVKTRPIGAV